jgi:hypothetical protein
MSVTTLAASREYRLDLQATFSSADQVWGTDPARFVAALQQGLQAQTGGAVTAVSYEVAGPTEERNLLWGSAGGGGYVTSFRISVVLRAGWASDSTHVHRALAGAVASLFGGTAAAQELFVPGVLVSRMQQSLDDGGPSDEAVERIHRVQVTWRDQGVVRGASPSPAPAPAPAAPSGPSPFAAISDLFSGLSRTASTAFRSTPAPPAPAPGAPAPTPPAPVPAPAQTSTTMQTVAIVGGAALVLGLAGWAVVGLLSPPAPYPPAPYPPRMNRRARPNRGGRR